MSRKKYSSGMIILSFLLSIFTLVAPVYFYIFHPESLDFNTKRKEPAWTGIITLWDFPRFDSKKGTNFGWIYERISAFEKMNPGVYIDFTPLSSDKGNEKIEAAIHNDGLPDIVPIGSNNSILANNTLIPLNKYLTKQEIGSYNSSILKSLTYNEQIFALPWMVNTYTLVLNLDLFRGKGVEPPLDGRWTYEEFVEKLKQLTFDSGEGRGKEDYYGFNGAINPGYYNMWGIILSDGADIFDQTGKYVFNDDRAVSGVQKLIDLKQTHMVTPKDFGEKSPNQAWTSFFKEKNIATFPVGTWGLKALDRLSSQGEGFNYTIASFPTGKNQEPIMMASDIGAFGIRSQEDIEKIKMCVEFIKFLADEKYQEELHRLGAFPVKNSMKNIYEGQVEMSKIQENLKYIKIFNLHPRFREVDEILQNEIILGVMGKKKAEKVVKDADTKIKELLSK